MADKLCLDPGVVAHGGIGNPCSGATYFLNYFHRLPVGNVKESYLEYQNNPRQVIVHTGPAVGVEMVGDYEARQKLVNHLQLGEALTFYAKLELANQRIVCRREDFL